MYRLRLLALVGALVVTATFAVAQEGDPPAANYYPLKAGNEWHFKVTSAGNVTTAISSVAEIEKIDDLALARLEATVNDRIVATEHLNQTAEGVFRHRNNGQKIVPPICLIKYPVKSGNKWDGPITVGKDKGKYTAEAKEVMVAVPAGKFKAMRVAIQLETGKETVTTTYWFVADLGFVKQTFQSKKLDITMELEKFVKGKSDKK